jgi:hypothetical protein
MRIAIISLALLAGCVTESDEIAGDDLASGKADDWFEPTRPLRLGVGFEVSATGPGSVVRGTFDPALYAGAMFTIQREMRISTFTRSWIGSGGIYSMGPWATQPVFFRWKGADGADVNDWKNWSLVSGGANNGDITLPAAGRYLLLVTATARAYQERTPYVAYLRHWTEYERTSVPIRGTLRCGAKNQPVSGALISNNAVAADMVETAADGTFALAAGYQVGRIELYSELPNTTWPGSFDVGVAPDGGAVDLHLETCP